MAEVAPATDDAKFAMEIGYQMGGASTHSITAKFNRKLTLRIHVPVIKELQRTILKALAGGESLDFKYYEQHAANVSLSDVRSAATDALMTPRRM